MAPAKQTPAFEKAVKDSRNLKAKPTDTELLELYGLFKQGTQDPPFAESKAPGMFELKMLADGAAAGSVGESQTQRVAEGQRCRRQARRGAEEVRRAGREAEGEAWLRGLSRGSHRSCGANESREAGGDMGRRMRRAGTTTPRDKDRTVSAGINEHARQHIYLPHKLDV